MFRNLKTLLGHEVRKDIVGVTFNRPVRLVTDKQGDDPLLLKACLGVTFGTCLKLVGKPV
jgi:hypothetical protein